MHPCGVSSWVFHASYQNSSGFPYLEEKNNVYPKGRTPVTPQRLFLLTLRSFLTLSLRREKVFLSSPYWKSPPYIIFISKQKKSFDLHHPISDPNMGLDILGRIRFSFNFLSECCHENTQGSNIVIPTAAPNVLGYKSMCQNLAHIF